MQTYTYIYLCTPIEHTHSNTQRENQSQGANQQLKNISFYPN